MPISRIFSAMSAINGANVSNSKGWTYLCQGLAKWESLMGVILALSLSFERMSYLCQWFIQYLATL